MSEKKITVLVTAVGAPPGFNLLRFLYDSQKFNLIAGDANPWSSGLYFYKDKGVKAVVLPKATDEREYVNALVSLAKKLNIKTILSGIETEIVMLSKYRKEFNGAGVKLLLPDDEILIKGRSKSASTEAAKSIGIRTPGSMTGISGKDGKDSVSSALKSFLEKTALPWIIKPSCGHGMHGVVKVESFDEALTVILNANSEVLIQEFIPGEVGSMYLVGLLYDENCKPVRAFSSRSVKTLFSSGGPATAGVSVLENKLIQKTKDLIAAIGPWRGPAAVEWMLDPRDDEFKYIEINPRIWGYSSLAAGSGALFHEWLAELSLGLDIGEDPGFKEGVFMIRSTWDVILEDIPKNLIEM